MKQTLVATPSNSQAVSTEGFDPSRKRYPRAARMVESTGAETLFKASMAFKFLREQLAARQGWRCFWCGGICDRPSGPAHKGDAMVATLEHLVPLRDGGATDASNCVMACRACNQNRDKEPWLYEAIATEAQRAATTGAVHEGAAPQGDRPNTGTNPTPQSDERIGE